MIRPNWLYTADELAAIMGEYMADAVMAALAERECLGDENFLKGCHTFLGRNIIEAHERVAKCLSKKWLRG